jgi:hypothetical protein
VPDTCIRAGVGTRGEHNSLWPLLPLSPEIADLSGAVSKMKPSHVGHVRELVERGPEYQDMSRRVDDSALFPPTGGAPVPALAPPHALGERHRADRHGLSSVISYWGCRDLPQAPFERDRWRVDPGKLPGDNRESCIGAQTSFQGHEHWSEGACGKWLGLPDSIAREIWATN